MHDIFQYDRIHDVIEDQCMFKDQAGSFRKGIQEFVQAHTVPHMEQLLQIDLTHD